MLEKLHDLGRSILKVPHMLFIIKRINWGKGQVHSWFQNILTSKTPNSHNIKIGVYQLLKLFNPNNRLSDIFSLIVGDK